MIKIQYKDFDDREQVLNRNKDKVLFEEQNITGGNYLIFKDVTEVLLESLTPTEKDVLEAEREIEILTLLQEVGLI